MTRWRAFWGKGRAEDSRSQVGYWSSLPNRALVKLLVAVFLMFSTIGIVGHIGVLVFGGGVLLAASAGFRFFDLTGLFGFALALFGAAVATQRFVTTLDRQRGVWTCGGDIFYCIRFRSRGLLSAVGSVRIGRRTVELSENRRGRLVTTYPVTVEAPKEGGGTVELRFGRFWSSVEKAHEVAGPLARFLDREVKDESGQDAKRRS